jgi:hypothetical protein
MTIAAAALAVFAVVVPVRRAAAGGIFDNVQWSQIGSQNGAIVARGRDGNAQVVVEDRNGALTYQHGTGQMQPLSQADKASLVASLEKHLKQPWSPAETTLIDHAKGTTSSQPGSSNPNRQKGIDLVKQARALRSDADQVEARCVAILDKARVDFEKELAESEKLEQEAEQKESTLEKTLNAKPHDLENACSGWLRAQWMLGNAQAKLEEAEGLRYRARRCEDDAKKLEDRIAKVRSDPNQQGYVRNQERNVDLYRGMVKKYEAQAEALTNDGNRIKHWAELLEQSVKKSVPGFSGSVPTDMQEIARLKKEAQDGYAKAGTILRQAEHDVDSARQKAEDDLTKAAVLEGEAEPLLAGDDNDKKLLEAHLLWWAANTDEKEAKIALDRAATIRNDLKTYTQSLQDLERQEQLVKAAAQLEKDSTKKQALLDAATAYTNAANECRAIMKELEEIAAAQEQFAHELTTNAQEARAAAQKLDPNVAKD